MPKDDNWFANINWSKTCRKCQTETNGICRSKSCAEYYYDDNGNEIPADSVQFDGDYQMKGNNYDH